MKILIGTPVHESCDYAMQRWLKNVFSLEYSADLLMVDNTPGPEYVEKVKSYFKKSGLKNYTIEHIELPPEQKVFERVARSREVIRLKLLSENYDAWFSWECDQIIPATALDTLVEIMTSGNFMIVSHNNWTRQIPDLPNFDLGVALISRPVLEKYSFILDFGTDPDMPATWEPGEAWLRKRVLRGGGNFVEIDGVIKPVYHLNK